MFNQAATTGSSLAGNYAVRQAVDVGTDTVLDTVQAVARGEDVNAKTIGRDLLTNTLMAGAKAAGGNGKNGIAGTQNNIKTDPDVAGSRSVFKTGSKGASGSKKITNDVIESPRKGSALKLDAYHAFNDIVDNYAGDAARTNLGNNATLHQIEGYLNGTNGRFEWITQDGNTTHRMFVPGGTMNGVPIKK